MHTEVDYFSNHRVKLRYPWRLYHAPIVTALQRVVARSSGPAVLNLGSGPFFELEQLNTYARRFTVCDIDRRAIALARERYGTRLVGADVLQADQPLPYASETFDLVVSMDVIEHVPDPLPWLREALRVLKPKGQLFLTTPNYGSRSLRVIEDTALEAIARVQGFSRKHLHPSKMDTGRLSRLLREAGVKRPRLERIAFSWVLAAYAGKS
jgi:SAM-dependent methyltransferase